MDYLIRGVTRNGNVRFLIASTKEICQTAHDLHHTTPTVSAALGRLLTAGAIIGSMLKDDSKLTLKIDANGPIGMMIVDASSNGQVRGFARNPNVDLPLNSKGKLDVGAAVGDLGILTVIKDIGFKNNFSSQTVLQSGEIGDDLSYYFYTSEQVPSVVGLGVLVDIDHSIKHAGGFIIQLLPGANDEDYDAIEELSVKYQSVTDLLQQYSIEEIAKLMFGDDVEYSKQELEFHCPCSKDRFINAIATISKDEILAMINEDHGCSITCEFCSKEHRLDENDLLKSLEIKESHQKRQ